MSGSIPDTITSTINNSAALLVFADLPKKAEECEKLHKFLNWIDYKCDSRQRAFWLNDSSLTMLPWSNMSCSNELDAYFKKIYENRKKCQGAQKSMCYAFPYQFSRRAVQSCPIFRIDSTGYFFFFCMCVCVCVCV